MKYLPYLMVFNNLTNMPYDHESTCNTPFTVGSNTATAAGLSRCCSGVVLSVNARSCHKLSRDNTASR